MKIVIDVPEEIIISLEQGNFGAKYNIYDLAGCLMNGTPLPKGHGRLIDADDLLDTNIDTFSQQTELKIKFAPTVIEADRGE